MFYSFSVPSLFFLWPVCYLGLWYLISRYMAISQVFPGSIPHLTLVWSEKTPLGCFSYFKLVKNLACRPLPRPGECCWCTWENGAFICSWAGLSLCAQSVRSSGLIVAFKSPVSLESIYLLCHLPGKRDWNQLCKFKCNCPSICYTSHSASLPAMTWGLFLDAYKFLAVLSPMCVWITLLLWSISLGLGRGLSSCRLLCLTLVRPLLLFPEDGRLVCPFPFFYFPPVCAFESEVCLSSSAFSESLLFMRFYKPHLSRGASRPFTFDTIIDVTRLTSAVLWVAFCVNCAFLIFFYSFSAFCLVLSKFSTYHFSSSLTFLS